jgi:hypothetical protein
VNAALARESAAIDVSQHFRLAANPFPLSAALLRAGMIAACVIRASIIRINIIKISIMKIVIINICIIKAYKVGICDKIRSYLPKQLGDAVQGKGDISQL